MKSYLYGAGVEYALHSLLILATSDAPISVVDLARFQQIPERYLAKVFTRMKDAQLVVGTEGVAGGFALARPAADIRVVEVLDAVDPDRKLFACAEIRRNCALFGETPPEWATAGSCRIDLFMTEAERTPPRLPRLQDAGGLGLRVQLQGACGVRRRIGRLVPGAQSQPHVSSRTKHGLIEPSQAHTGHSPKGRSWTSPRSCERY